jgi:SpoVK/Ycf46/Vps4 family AAA+-type ATPase
MRIVHPFQKPELFKAYGKKGGGGMLFYGPPGCGKTFLARATAGECGAHFMAVGLHEVLDMWIGNSERQLHAIFEDARRRAPTVLFFDEVDALGMQRAKLVTGAMRGVITQFLSELDGFASPNERVLVIGATNTPWDLDPAFRRPGRFDQVLFVPPPDAPARAQILKLKLGDKPQGPIDLARLAEGTEGWSGADLEHLIEGATELAIAARDARRARWSPSPWPCWRRPGRASSPPRGSGFRPRKTTPNTPTRAGSTTRLPTTCGSTSCDVVVSRPGGAVPAHGTPRDCRTSPPPRPGRPRPRALCVRGGGVPRSALAADPRDDETLVILTRAQLGAGHLEAAVESARRVVEIAPMRGYGHYLLGFALQCLGRYEASLGPLGEALALEPLLGRYHVRMALSLAEQGAAAEAVATVDRAMQLSPRDGVVLEVAARVLGQCA